MSFIGGEVRGSESNRARSRACRSSKVTPARRRARSAQHLPPSRLRAIFAPFPMRPLFAPAWLRRPARLLQRVQQGAEEHRYRNYKIARWPRSTTWPREYERAMPLLEELVPLTRGTDLSEKVYYYHAKSHVRHEGLHPGELLPEQFHQDLPEQRLCGGVCLPERLLLLQELPRTTSWTRPIPGPRSTTCSSSWSATRSQR